MPAPVALRVYLIINWLWSIPHVRTFIFQENPRWVAIRVKTHVGGIYSGGGSPKDRCWGEDLCKRLTCSGDHYRISNYRLAQCIQRGRVFIFQEAP